jgi:hypothetical protein
VNLPILSRGKSFGDRAATADAPLDTVLYGDTYAGAPFCTSCAAGPYILLQFGVSDIDSCIHDLLYTIKTVVAVRSTEHRLVHKCVLLL